MNQTPQLFVDPSQDQWGKNGRLLGITRSPEIEVIATDANTMR